MSSLDDAIDTVLKHEGGYVDDPADPGGETKYGISKRAHPDVDIKGLTVDGASAIYYEKYWTPNGYDRIDDQAVATKVFDLGVNMGPRRAHRLVQRAVRAASGEVLKDDGILGPMSFAAINACLPAALLAALKVEAAYYYKGLGNERFLNGWLNRAYS